MNRVRLIRRIMFTKRLRWNRDFFTLLKYAGFKGPPLDVLVLGSWFGLLHPHTCAHPSLPEEIQPVHLPFPSCFFTFHRFSNSCFWLLKLISFMHLSMMLFWFNVPAKEKGCWRKKWICMAGIGMLGSNLICWNMYQFVHHLLSRGLSCSKRFPLLFRFSLLLEAYDYAGPAQCHCFFVFLIHPSLSGRISPGFCSIVWWGEKHHA